MCKGFIKIPRRIFLSDIWNEKREYSRYEALIDLYQSADMKSHRVAVSFRSLADRWRWSLWKVQDLIKRLTNEGYITVEQVDKCTVITVDNTPNNTPYNTPDNTPKTQYTEGFREVCNTPDNTPNNTPDNTHRAYKNDNINIMSMEELKEYIASSLRSEAAMSTKVDASSVAGAFLLLFNMVIDKEKSSICKVRDIKGQRLVMLNARIREHDADAVFEVFEKASKSDFLNGHGNRGFMATIDWLLKPTNFQKTLEGNYDNVKKQNGTDTRTDHQKDEHPSDCELRQQSVRVMQRLKAERTARQEAIRDGNGFLEEGEP